MKCGAAVASPCNFHDFHALTCLSLCDVQFFVEQPDSIDVQPTHALRKNNQRDHANAALYQGLPGPLASAHTPVNQRDLLSTSFGGSRLIVLTPITFMHCRKKMKLNVPRDILFAIERSVSSMPAFFRRVASFA